VHGVVRGELFRILQIQLEGGIAVGRLSLGHGSGGRLTNDLVKKIASAFARESGMLEFEDCALLPGGWGVTIDGFTVSPLSFPGGDIGKLAVCGSVNDLAVRGVRPLWLAMSLLAEEGLDEEELFTYMKSAASVCAELGVQLVAGDTKVLPKGQADRLYIATCAMGKNEAISPWGIKEISPGDTVIVSGPVGRHGAVIASLRYDIKLRELESDCAPLWPLIEPLTRLLGVHAARDCTRGGLGTVLCEWAEVANVGIEIDEEAIPADGDVSAVSDILGFDPLYLACEGTAVFAVASEWTETVLETMRSHPLGRSAAAIGKVTEAHPGLVGLRTSAGGMRVVDMQGGELLPRIC
jgi:hydrogenase expression/formation protein HypE